MRIIERDGFSARCEARGVQRQISLFLLQHEDLAPGDFVMVHMGEAIETMNEEAARAAWDLYDEMLAAEAAATPPG
ncbi:MAG: HypC/HybG/HupF family hydrogenase formation chaperone [Sphingomonadales bacterium]|nr:HypC/HybG/HupF family hydrogenase formation chaperone [Sphingomonadales bacterium]